MCGCAPGRPVPPPPPSSGSCRLQPPVLPQPRPRKEPEAGARAEVGPAAMAVTAPESALPPLPLPPRRGRAGPVRRGRGRTRGKETGPLPRRAPAPPGERRAPGALVTDPPAPRGPTPCQASAGAVGCVFRLRCFLGALSRLTARGGRGAERCRCPLVRGRGWPPPAHSPWPPAPPGRYPSSSLSPASGSQVGKGAGGESVAEKS